jgi:putative SOS response-associated peptidase YedK
MYTWQELVSLYHLSVPAMTNLQPRYNICPTDTIDVVVRGGDDRALVPMRWGLVPEWWNKPLKEMRLATFNARSESIAKKPMFRDSFRTRRCLIPATGYYEWLPTPRGKQPYYFTRHDGQVTLGFGGTGQWGGTCIGFGGSPGLSGHDGPQRASFGSAEIWGNI